MKCLVAAVWILIALHVVDCRAASGDMHHCIGSSGEPVFSDRPCPNPAPDIGQDGASPDTGGQRGICATSAAELRTRSASAFARHDAIALSGLFLWRGYGNGSARGLLKELATLVRQPLLALDIRESLDDGYDRQADQWFDDRQIADTATLELAIAVDAPDAIARTRETRFPLVDESGCWWLLPD